MTKETSNLMLPIPESIIPTPCQRLKCKCKWKRFPMHHPPQRIATSIHPNPQNPVERSPYDAFFVALVLSFINKNTIK